VRRDYQIKKAEKFDRINYADIEGRGIETSIYSATVIKNDLKKHIPCQGKKPVI